MQDCVILGGRSHPELLDRICRDIDTAPVLVEAMNFANGETSVKIKDSVREKTVYVVQSACGEVNDMFMELLITISACKAASARSVVAVLPLFPYSRQLSVRQALSRATREEASSSHGSGSDVPDSPRPGYSSSPLFPGHHFAAPKTPTKGGLDAGDKYSASPKRLSNSSGRQVASGRVGREIAHNSGHRFWVANSGELIASLLTTAGADHVITMDLHDPQYQGFFDIPVDNLYGRPLFEQYISTMIPQYQDAVIVSPDAGGAKRATSIADHLGLSFALIHKDDRTNAAILVGNVLGRVAVIMDDLVDSGRTMTRAAKVVRDNGATKVYAICTHGIFSGECLHRFKRSCIDLVVTTNTVPQDEHKEILGDRLQVVDVAPVFAEAIRRIHNGESISMLFDHAIGVL